MSEKGLPAGAAEAQGPDDAGGNPSAPQPAVFAPGGERLSEPELKALSPQEILWRHRSVAGLPDALILIVDGELRDGERIQAFLADAGYRRFVQADDPGKALALMRGELPGVLLLDLELAKAGGMQLLASLRDDPELRHVPVIVLSGSADPQVKRLALAAGAMDVLSKPVDPAELGLRLRNLLAASAYRDYLGQHDALTGLPNKQRYRKEVAQVLAAAASAGNDGALLHVGIDALGRINDALGRAVGDQLLQRVARSLASCVQTEAGGELSSDRHNPTLYRFDGDEFAVIVPFMEGVHSAAAFITKLLEDATVNFQRPGAPELFVTCSVGVSVFPTDGMDPDRLMRNAGLALRHAKLAGPHRYEFFSPAFDEKAQSRLDLGAELRHAIARDEIELMYEPRVELATGRVVAAQTIVRWKHASGRIVEGDELMELAGGSEMDVALTEWAFEQLRKHMKNWRGAGLQPIATGLKVSLANMRPGDLGRLVNAAIEAGIDPHHVTLELQHVEAIEGLSPQESAAMAALRKKGVRLALDRFGGDASVVHLRKLMCDEIKVDASFVADLEKNASVRGMLLGIGDLAGRVHLSCVACGVDNAAQLAFLSKNGWDQGQGRIFGEPLSGLAFAAKWLTRSGKPQRVPHFGESA